MFHHSDIFFFICLINGLQCDSVLIQCEFRLIHLQGLSIFKIHELESQEARLEHSF